MRRFFPDGILGWLLLILVTGILASQAVTVLLHNLSRNQMVLRIETERAADRIATLAVFLGHTTPVLRQGVAGAMSGPRLDARVTGKPLVASAVSGSRFDLLARTVAGRLEGLAWSEVRSGPAADDEPGRVRVSIGLADGSWLNFEFPLALELPWVSPPLLGFTVASIVAVLALCFYALVRVTRPLESLTIAAESLGRSGTAQPLAETGVGEVRRAAAAFNRMQARIGRLIEDRLQMIAAISHDLRTPITRLRLRAELMEDDETRAKVLADLAEMETMIGATLDFAREEGNPEPRRETDLRLLVKEAGEHQPMMRLQVAGEGRWQVVVQPLAMKRAIANLIDNAVKYGGEAVVTLSRRGERYEIRIDDRGPGIPAEEAERVFRPFYRIESSRNRLSGGTGLGLAIARSVVLAHGGEIELANRPGGTAGGAGGLSVRVSLPA